MDVAVAPDLGIDVGPYRLIELVEKGSFSSVYQAKHRFLGTIHAMKMVHPEVDKAVVDALAQEARIQARIVHRHVARVTDGGSWRGRIYLVLDWVPGKDLEQLIDGDGLGGVGDRLRLFRGLVRGVHAMHRRHVVHRDLKPSNVMVREVGRRREAVVIDFHLAKILTPGAAPEPVGLSREFATLGTPGYMAPEQVTSVGSVDTRADLFSLGAILYEMVSGQPAFVEDDEHDLFLKGRLERYVPLADVVPGVDPELCDMVTSLLKADPTRRLGSARRLLLALDAHLSRRGS